MRGTALLFGLVATTLFAQEPSKDPDSFDIEPPLLIPNRDDEQPSNAEAATSAPARDVDLAKLEKELERAKRNAAGAERLCKIGALSKLEVEQRVLRYVHLEFDLANVAPGVSEGRDAEKRKAAERGRDRKDGSDANRSQPRACNRSGASRDNQTRAGGRCCRRSQCASAGKTSRARQRPEIRRCPRGPKIDRPEVAAKRKSLVGFVQVATALKNGKADLGSVAGCLSVFT
jgi:hypothetical protein